VSAAQVAGVTQRALARSRAAADPTDIDATLAAASLSSSDVLLAGRIDGLMAFSSRGAEEAGAARGLWEDDPRPLPNEAQRLFGASSLIAGAARGRGDAGRTLDVEYRLTVEVKLRALLSMSFCFAHSTRARICSSCILRHDAGPVDAS
jgi:hypothetical protein